MFNKEIVLATILGAMTVSYGIFIISGMLPYIAAKHTGDSERKLKACKIMLATATLCFLTTIASVFV